jgi:hypothetical protein
MGRLLLAALVAIRVMSRIGASQAQLRGMLRPALALLDASPPGSATH